MPQHDNYIEQIHRLEDNRPLRGFATPREANTPSVSECRANRLVFTSPIIIVHSLICDTDNAVIHSHTTAGLSHFHPCEIAGCLP